LKNSGIVNSDLDHSFGVDAGQASRESGGFVDIVDEAVCGIWLIKEVEVTA